MRAQTWSQSTHCALFHEEMRTVMETRCVILSLQCTGHHVWILFHLKKLHHLPFTSFHCPNTLLTLVSEFGRDQVLLSHKLYVNIRKVLGRSIGFHYEGRQRPLLLEIIRRCGRKLIQTNSKKKFILKHFNSGMLFIFVVHNEMCFTYKTYVGPFIHIKVFVIMNHSKGIQTVLSFFAALIEFMEKSEQAIWTNLCVAGATACNGPYLASNFTIFMRIFYGSNCYRASFLWGILCK